MANLTALEAIRQIETIAVSNQERQDTVLEFKVRDIAGKVGIGEAYRQGDLYVFRVESNHPVGEKLTTRQLAEGTSIGARHVLISDEGSNGTFQLYEGVKIPDAYKGDYADVALGVAFDVKGGTVVNAHPEHCNYRLPEGRYQVLHQVDMRTQERVAD